MHLSRPGVLADAFWHEIYAHAQSAPYEVSKAVMDRMKKLQHEQTAQLFQELPNAGEALQHESNSQRKAKFSISLLFLTGLSIEGKTNITGFIQKLSKKIKNSIAAQGD